jgi:hypothetical protein
MRSISIQRNQVLRYNLTDTTLKWPVKGQYTNIGEHTLKKINKNIKHKPQWNGTKNNNIQITNLITEQIVKQKKSI